MSLYICANPQKVQHPDDPGVGSGLPVVTTCPHGPLTVTRLYPVGRGSCSWESLCMGARGTRRIAEPPLQFCCKPTTTLKNNLLKISFGDREVFYRGGD